MTKFELRTIVKDKTQVEFAIQSERPLKTTEENIDEVICHYLHS